MSVPSTWNHRQSLVHKQANPTGLVPVDFGLCTTFVFTRICEASSAETREPPGQAQWGRLFDD